MPVPLFDTETPLAPLRGAILAAAQRVLEGSRYILGPEVAAFERELADYCVSLPQPTAGSLPAWHLYVIGHERIDELAIALGEAGIGHKAYYRVPIHRQPVVANLA
ncbi:MAG: hypothetical protein ACYCUM_06165 [Solirubrobacteraceae bacterium]